MGEQVITMPVVALRGLTILPGMVLHFDINRPKSVAAVERAMVGDQKLFLVAQRHPEIVEPEQGDLFQIGTIAVVKQLVKLPGKVVRVLVEGLERAELLCLEAEEPAMMGEIAAIEAEEDDLDSLTQEAMLRILKDKLEEYGRVNPKITKEILPNLLIITDLNEMLDQIAIQLPWDYTIRQTVLENSSLSARYEVVMHTLLTEMEIYRIKKEFQEKVKSDIDQNQKEYILREQMKVIRQELGEDAVSDADEYQKKLDALKADKEVKEKLHKEIERFRNMPAGSQEANVLRTYVETLLDLPWKKMSKDNDDIKHAEKILNEDHYGLEQVKERILEYLAVRALTKKGTSPIICLVGPPGTGKTSIARSVARALDKKYVRICLGGVKDEAEIRGHRRTYVGAMPGRLIQGIRQAGVKNPLMLLDEIDKMSSDYKGDPSSAMLEVLDSEQNAKFIDHYVDMPVDLSEVLFIATANDVHTIPRPLLDRMELIEVSSYTENEKMHIAKEHLLGKQIEKNGLEPEQLTITDEAMHQIISGYTREAGVRNLERKIGEICRKAAREIYEGTCESVFVDEKQLEQYLGKERFHVDRINDQDEIGIVRGLAWTSVGGDTLQIEVNVMPGKGEFKLTGQLGDVMKESAQAGISYIRSVGASYDIPEDFFTKHDIHIHIPEGAVPKDGPSAGITMATAMLSAITKKPVRADVAMTGEITLRGRVLPIGGLKEKLLAAKTAGIRTVCVPAQNKADIAEISEEIREGLQICYVKKMEEVLKIAMNGGTNDH